MHVLRYNRPAREWTEALPIGNGLQGAMLFGGTAVEHVQTNEGTAWSGSPANASHPPVVSPHDARRAIAEAREALAADEPTTADAAVRRLQHRYSQAFLPFADLEIRLTPAGARRWHKPVTEYERCLDLDSAQHQVRYVRDGIDVRQTAFASHPGRVLVHRIRTDKPVDVTLTLSSPLRTLSWFGPGGIEEGNTLPLELGLLLQLPSDLAPPHEDVAEPIAWNPTPGAALRAAITLGITHNGLTTPLHELASATLTLHAVTELDSVIGTATTFTGLGLPPSGNAHRTSARATASVRDAFARGIEEVRRRQTADHRELYRRVRWEIAPGSTPPNIDRKPLDARLTEANAAEAHPLAYDPGLAPLLFHYGRYLLISCSRRGGTPANLQGIWNQELRPPWSSNYTTNINLQMNYWGADAANLPETLPPLFGLIDTLSRTGRETAERLYGARGWVAHHNTDIWGYSQLVGRGHADPKWAFWPFAGPWLVRHLHDHLSFGARSATNPEAFARETVWPITRAAAEFVLDWLIPTEDGALGTAPSTSPENSFLAPDGKAAAVTRSSTLDLALSRELLTSLIRLAQQLDRDDELITHARTALAHIPAPSLGRDGTVREWTDDPVAEDPHHRHQSHLYALHPGSEPLAPELRAAAARSLDLRGDESTGWSLAWRMALRARLLDPAAVDRLLALLFRDMATDRGSWSGGLYPNLLAAHPPFQIDGNLGYVAAIAECLVQSHDGRITLLPSIPETFPAGSITGLVARPGIQVDLTWSDSTADEPRRLVRAKLTPLGRVVHNTHEITYGGTTIEITLDEAPLLLDQRSFTR